jgi:GntR family transcriptional regulator, transcriptional repressor for pyruvate dehydrogenase complex
MQQTTDLARPLKASMAIAADFREQIARGELRAGDPLPVESELTEQLGVSKSIVREALRILETEGLVEVRRGLGGGPRVRHPTIVSTAQAMGVYLQIGDVLVHDVFEARDRIIANAVERLALTPHVDIADLEHAVAGLESLVGHLDAYYPQIIEVGETAVRLAGNRTEHVLVAALRYVIAAELEMGTHAADDITEAVDAEVEVARAWAETCRHIRGGRARAAQRAYEKQAQLVRDGLEALFPESTVVDVFTRIDGRAHS